MHEYFVKKAPFQIPTNGKKALVEWAPILALIGGVLSFLAGLSLWRAGHTADQIINVANTYIEASGMEAVEKLGATYYISLLFLFAQGVLLLVAYSGLKSRSKSKGWDLLLLGVIANVLYGLIVSFTPYGSAGNIFASVVGAIISLYILAQIQSYYKDHTSPAKQKV